MHFLEISTYMTKMKIVFIFVIIFKRCIEIDKVYTVFTLSARYNAI